LLKPDWKYDGRKRQFRKEGAEPVLLKQDLPARAKVAYTTPDLARLAVSELTPDERKLARYVNVVLPPGSDTDALLTSVRRWKCVEDAWVGPDVALP
jgi:hypothetical protein